MLLEALVLSIIVGYLRGGSLLRLEKLQIKLWWLILVAFLVQFLIPLSGKSFNLSPSLGFYIMVSTYLLLLISLGLNYRERYFQIMGGGVLANFLVIILNGGMPVQAHIPRLDDFLHLSMTQATRLKFLGDVLYLPTVYPKPGWAYYSVGDVLISIGVFLLVQSYMVYRPQRLRRKKRQNQAY